MTSTLLWTLIALQIAMGAFDTLYHHELTERLAWRSSQKAELRLHAVRNGLYGVLFLALGWVEAHGLLAILAIAALLVEVVITLWDFVEEDLSRSLPATERVNHTLLTLNYGAILALLLPVLLDWAAMPTGLLSVSYGYWTALATTSAIAVVVFGVRDWVAADRCARLGQGAAAPLTDALGSRKTILVTGATGFVGQRLVDALAAGGHDVVALVRSTRKAASLAVPHRVVSSLDQIAAGERIHAIVNLGGEPISNGLWTRRKRDRIVGSRVALTRDIVALCERLRDKPDVLVSGSAVGWYGIRADETLTESDNGHACFSKDVCETWENEAVSAARLGIRVVLLRMGLVLGTEGGFLSRLLMPFEFGFGAVLGSGRQWVSWITRDDLVRLVAHVIATPLLVGAVNATAPEPVRGSEFMKELAGALHRPLLLRIPAAPLRFLGGAFADELLLGGQRVLPARTLTTGFTFKHSDLRTALRAMLGWRASRKLETATAPFAKQTLRS